MIKRLVAATAVVALALTACSGGTGAGTAGGSGGGNAPVNKIKIVAAEYSKDNTAAFWNKFAADYKAKTGIDLDVQVVSWDDIDQQVSTMIQNNQPPDILNLNSFSSYAKDGLLYSADEALSPKTRDDFLEPSRAAAPTRARSTASRILASARASSTTATCWSARRSSRPGPGTSWCRGPGRCRPSATAPSATRCRWARGGAGASGPSGCGTTGATGSRATRGRSTADKNVQTLTFLAALATDRVTQVNPGKTNRTDGAFQLFKDGKVGMVMGFCPLAASSTRRARCATG